ncbi:MBL fold metallo-hydrolase RNA specificity domain-containing protein [Desulfospira joergensenii]|uniref:MBL fold metallo-hydrolase RNA specificity domain-containing protein n=1 Tax=Desulfospira joergensenii TaxID=53329 RepID=UPI0003B713EB|nr:MBL fold metallo-hydrolase RNA specificity domain-containing protein [Desulfospira joergensenii]
MLVTFYGGTREVTGSMHMITTQQDRILLDCGLFQGRRKDTAEKNRILPFDPRILTNVILSHAHIDHSGRIPLLVKKNFTGRIFSTRATHGACEYLLPDSAHIQESDADYLNYKAVRSLLADISQGKGEEGTGKRDAAKAVKLLKSGKNSLNREAIDGYIRKYSLERAQSLYSTEDAKAALGSFEGIPCNNEVTIGKDMTCTFYEAGHILGSAISIIKYRDGDRTFTVCYTGDLGRFDKPILKDPAQDFNEADRNVDLMIMESTYGNRTHEGTEDLYQRLRDELNTTFDKGGTVVIPSFAFGRAQELLYVIHELFMKGEVPRVPVYVDSPLASSMTKVFGEHPETYDRETHKTFLETGRNPFIFDKVHFVSSVDESMKLMREEKPHIVISASGMCEVGRILHHLRYRVHNPNNTILIVGYMAEHTLGRKILTLGQEYMESGQKGEPPMIKILGKEYPLKARVVRLGGFSAHADQKEMMRFLKGSNLDVKKIAVVHGEEQSSLSFADHLNQQGFQAFVPHAGETIRV